MAEVEKVRKCVVAFVVDDCDRALLVWNKRRALELPGGGVEDGELLSEAVIRELLEETGRYAHWDFAKTIAISGMPKPGADYRSEIHVFFGTQLNTRSRLSASDEVEGVALMSKSAVLKVHALGALSDLASREILLEWARGGATLKSPEVLVAEQPGGVREFVPVGTVLRWPTDEEESAYALEREANVALCEEKYEEARALTDRLATLMGEVYQGVVALRTSIHFFDTSGEK